MKRKINIEQNKSINELKKEFNNFYQYLKIEFFKEPCIKGGRLSKDKLITSNAKVGTLQKIKNSGELLFTDDTIVGDFEQLFFKNFGLCIQVFRKSGNVWLETSATDNWSLETQNEEGKSLAQHWNIERENTDDHDIY